MARSSYISCCINIHRILNNDNYTIRLTGTYGHVDYEWDLGKHKLINFFIKLLNHIVIYHHNQIDFSLLIFDDSNKKFHIIKLYLLIFYPITNLPVYLLYFT